MEFFNPKSNVNFMGARRWTVMVSLLLIVGSIISLATKGLNLSLDFTGGSLVEVHYAQPVEQSEVSAALEKAGIHHAVVQRFDSTNLAIRLDPAEVVKLASGITKAEGSSLDTRNSQISESLQKALTASGRQVTVKPSVYVGPQVGADFKWGGLVAVFVVLVGIVVY